MKNRGEMETEVIGWWILALAAGFLTVMAFIYFKEDIANSLQYAKNLLRFR